MISCSDTSADERYLQLECDQLIYLFNLVCSRRSDIQPRNYNRIWVRRGFPAELFVLSHSGRGSFTDRVVEREMRVCVTPGVTRLERLSSSTVMHASSSSKVSGEIFHS